jgi:hypothetical protein
VIGKPIQHRSRSIVGQFQVRFPASGIIREAFHSNFPIGMFLKRCNGVVQNEGAAISGEWPVEIGCFSASTLIKTWVLGQQMVWVWWG